MEKTKEELLAEIEELRKIISEFKVELAKREYNDKNEELFKTLFEKANDGIFLMNMNYKISAINESFAQMHGYTIHEMKNMDLQKLDTPETFQLLPERMKKVLNGETIKFEVDHYHKQGYIVTQEVISSLVKIRGDNYILAFHRDITDRKKAEIALKESELKFRTIADYTYSWEYWKSETGQIIYMSPSCERVTGYTQNEFTNDPELIKKIIHPEDMISIGYHFEEIHWQENRNEIEELDFRIIKKDGSILYINHICRPVYDEDNKYHGRRVSNRDITERKYFELALKESEEKYRIIFQNNHTTKLIIEPETGNILDANPAASNLYGYSKEELLSMKIFDINILPIEDVKKEMNLAKEEQHNYFQFKHRKANREFIDVEVYSSPIKINGKTLLHSIIHDITDRIRIEKELKENEIFLNTIIDNLPIGFEMFDARGYAVKINKVNLELLGLQEKDKPNILGKFNVFADPSIIESRMIKNIERAYRGETIKNIEIYFPMEKASKKWNTKSNDIFLEQTLFPIFNIQGNIQAVISLITDITDKKNKEKLLVDTIATKDKFFSIIAHDLRSPFNGFLGLTQLIEEHDHTNEEVKEYSKLIHQSANDLLKLLENLLTWARIQRGKIEFNPDIINIYNIVNQNLKIMHELAKQKNIEINNHVPENLKVVADISMFNTIIRNLLSNAIKFTQKGGKVIVLAEEKNEEMLICIHDTGIGMNKQILDSLFKIEQKNSRSGTEGESSAGLGLILCKEFVEKHGGEIWVESEVDKGSVFKFTLPKH